MNDKTDTHPPMTSEVPHLIPAFHAWITENNLTPLMQVLVDYPGVDLPENASTTTPTLLSTSAVGVVATPLKSMILNVSYQATKDLTFSEYGVGLNGRFNGVSRSVFVPWLAITQLFARERPQLIYMPNQDHAILPDGKSLSDSLPTAPQEFTPPPQPPKPKGSHLKLVK